MSDKAGKSPSPQQRQAILRRRRDEKMARSAHAYVRGSTVQFYAWLREAPRRRLPEGPAIWICGDCHVGNLGPIADFQRSHRHPDPRSRPDGDRQPRPRPDPARPVPGDRGARRRPAGGHHRPHAGGDDPRL
ncbi:MAG: DUF2252 family protein [Caulobacteraceae bacterium]